MKPKTCETCKWWKLCHDEEYKECGNYETKNRINVEDYPFYTDKDFGCIFHEKEEK